MVSLALRTGLFQKPFNGISMLLCPEANHTSPIKTLFNTTSSPSEIDMEYGVNPAGGVEMEAIQFPLASAFTLVTSDVHEGRTATVFPGADFPQIFTLVFCCRTMLSLIISGNETFAPIELEKINRSINGKILNFILVGIY